MKIENGTIMITKQEIEQTKMRLYYLSELIILPLTFLLYDYIQSNTFDIGELTFLAGLFGILLILNFSWLLAILIRPLNYLTGKIHRLYINIKKRIVIVNDNETNHERNKQI